jgi:hypothetical protein
MMLFLPRSRWSAVLFVALLVATTLAGCSQRATLAESGEGPPARPDVDAGACGAEPWPDCPLQSWMKGNASTALAASDLPRLESAFKRMAAFAPAGYEQWRRIATEGANAARRGSLDECRHACKDCHDSLRVRYRAEMRTRPIR